MILIYFLFKTEVMSSTENCLILYIDLLIYFIFFLSLFYFKYKFIYFNWKLITLQNCIGFAIHQHEFTKGNLF